MSQVDVVIPCYNYGRFLAECVASVLAQEGVALRVLVIDDSSSDLTPEVCAELAARDCRIEVRRHSVNRGHIATYNEGLDWAQGDYTLLLSADDILIAGALKRAARVMDSHPQVALTYGREMIFRSGERLPAVPAADGNELTIMAGRQFLELACSLARNIVPTPTALVRTEVQKRIGGYRPELPHSGDIEMWLRFGAHASVCALDAWQAYTRLHTANMRLQYPGARDYRQLKAAFDTFFDEFGSRLGEASALRELACRNLGERILDRAHFAFDTGRPEECRELLLLAEETWPDLRAGSDWARLRWKRRLKPVLPLLRSVRSAARRLGTVGATQEGVTP